ncbi:MULTISPECIES: hypothetical protein [Acetobacter]|uniref:hypothetical protein n=1 Tax=Acetobacter TaxID=434 RepID=UPI00376F8BB8
MRLPGSETWSDADVEAWLAFSENLHTAVSSIIQITIEQNLPGGPIILPLWTPTDVIYQQGDAVGLAFVTDRLDDGMRIASNISKIDIHLTRQTLMQCLFSATLGALTGTTKVRLSEEKAIIETVRFGRIELLNLTDYSLSERHRLVELIVPAAFASTAFIDEVHDHAGEGLDQGYKIPQLDLFARRSPLVRVAHDYQQTGKVNQSLLMGSLLDYEGYIATLQDDQEEWNEIPLRGSLIDWPLLATLVGVHRWTKTDQAHDLTVGPATRFLQDLAREIATRHVAG